MWKKGAVLLYAKRYRTADTHQKMVLLMFWLQSISFTLSFASNTAIQHLCNIRASKTYTLTENWCSPSLKTKKKKNKQNPTTGHSQTSKQLPTPTCSLLLDQQDHPTRLMVTQRTDWKQGQTYNQGAREKGEREKTYCEISP